MKAAIRKRIPKPVIVDVGPETKQTRLAGPGRPRYIAVLEYCDTDYYAEFRAVIATLCYRERMALSRALGVGYTTVVAWQKHRSCPGNWDMAAQVIAWGQAGKPVTTQVPPTQLRYLRQAAALRRLGLLPPLQAG